MRIDIQAVRYIVSWGGRYLADNGCPQVPVMVCAT